MNHRILSLALCGALVGCSKLQAAQSGAPLLNEGLASASASKPHPTAPTPPNPRDFGGMFANEAANRPTGTVKTEAAIAAFQKAGIELNTVRQHLGRPYGARYCVGALAGTAVALSVCEYIDPEAAQSGTDTSRKLVLANREIRINQATTLTVREVEKTPAADAVAKTLFDSFAKL